MQEYRIKPEIAISAPVLMKEVGMDGSFNGFAHSDLGSGGYAATLDLTWDRVDFTTLAN
ncbi:hypothetical protein [Altericroceibacterium spongiae]|uniref:hypothetical protein n=1 Tax=Altericroceibacterium spongiae TaxID=2320269 RepID=UPI00160404FB|nr:hypothetical protein [Altericroceibacterium spongiae]